MGFETDRQHACTGYYACYSGFCQIRQKLLIVLLAQLAGRCGPGLEQIGPLARVLLRGIRWRRHLTISAWLPPIKTGGTATPSYTSLAACSGAQSSKPLTKLSSTRRRIVAQHTGQLPAPLHPSSAIAGNSPPDSTKSPRLISSSIQRHRAISGRLLHSGRTARSSPDASFKSITLAHGSAACALRRHEHHPRRRQTEVQLTLLCRCDRLTASGFASITMPGPPPYGRSSTVR